MNPRILFSLAFATLGLCFASGYEREKKSTNEKGRGPLITPTPPLAIINPHEQLENTQQIEAITIMEE
jgi:hypothetical protein